MLTSFFASHPRRFNLIWRSPERFTNVAKLTSHILRFPRFPRFTPSKNNWNQVTFLFTHSQSEGGGAYSSRVALFVNGALGHMGRVTRFPAGVRTLYAGASPSRRYGVRGRLFQLLVSSSAFTEDQVSLLVTNHAEDVKAVAQLCEGTYLLRSEPAPLHADSTPPAMPWARLVAEASTKPSSRTDGEAASEAAGEASRPSKQSSRPSTKSSRTSSRTSSRVQREEALAEQSEEATSGPQAAREGAEDSVRGHAAPTESPNQSQATIAEADLRDSEERAAQAQLDELAQCPIVGSPVLADVQTPPSELLQRYVDREAFVPHKKAPGSLRGGEDALLRPPPAERDEYCTLTPPKPLPALSGELERFVELLLAKDGAEIREGKFQFAVPEELHDEYHYLSEYRAQYIREAFCFAWAG